MRPKNPDIVAVLDAFQSGIISRRLALRRLEAIVATKSAEAILADRKLMKKSLDFAEEVLKKKSENQLAPGSDYHASKISITQAKFPTSKTK